jgi:hypothetical protein
VIQKGGDPKRLRSDPVAKQPSIGLRRKFLMKTPDGVETPLMLAFRAAQRGPTASGGPDNHALAQFDYWRIRNVFALSYAQLSALRKPCH